MLIAGQRARKMAKLLKGVQEWIPTATAADVERWLDQEFADQAQKELAIEMNSVEELASFAEHNGQEEMLGIVDDKPGADGFVGEAG